MPFSVGTVQNYHVCHWLVYELIIFQTVSDKIPFCGPCKEEPPHLAEVYNPKSTAKLDREVIRQLLNQLVAVVGSGGTSLLRFNDSPTDFPVDGGHDGIDIVGGC